MPQRVRRGNTDDHASLRKAVLEAAFKLHSRGGMDALSMRSIGAELGVSPMALYRYFASKTDIVNAMWGQILNDASASVQAAVGRCRTPRTRLRASIEAAMHYWENHPEQFELVFMTHEMAHEQMRDALTGAEEYRRLVSFSQKVVEEFIADVGGDPRAVRLALDLRLSMVIGYLHSSVFNHRHPWSDLAALRQYTTDAIIRAIEECVRKAPRRSAELPGS